MPRKKKEIEEIPDYLPVGNRKKFVIKQIFDCIIKKDLTFDEMVEILDLEAKHLSNSINELELFIMKKDLTPHIIQFPELYEIGTKTVIIKLTRTLKDDKQSFSYLIVNFSGLVFYMGNGYGIKKLQDKFETVLMDITNDTYDTSNGLFFRHDFLFWLFIKFRRSEFDLDKLVTLKNITDTKVIKLSGAQSYMGNEISSSDTKDVTKSLPILNCLLANYRIKTSTFRIKFHGCEPAFQIIDNSKIYFRKDELLWDFLKIEQFIMGIFAIKEFIRIYNGWKRNTKKYGIDISQEDISAMVEDSEEFSNTIQCERNAERAYNSMVN